MANILLVFVLLVTGIGGAAGDCPPGKVCLRPATVFPESLDELYQFIETGAGNWVFTACSDAQMTITPKITWKQVKAIEGANADSDESRVVIATDDLLEVGLDVGKTGTLSISEDALFAEVARAGLLGLFSGKMTLCAPPGDKVQWAGAGVQDLLDALGGYVK